MTTKAELEKRVAELETELAWRRNHVCPQPYIPPVTGTCTCGTGRDLTYPPPCPVHGYPLTGRVFTTTLRPGQNACGAADNGFGNVVINTAGCADRRVLAMPLNNTACAAGRGGHTCTVMVPAG